MRLFFTAAALFCAVMLTGCAGMKLGGGYNFETKQFFVNLEKPLDGLKK
jgi:hypothetical protein